MANKPGGSMGRPGGGYKDNTRPKYDGPTINIADWGVAEKAEVCAFFGNSTRFVDRVGSWAGKAVVGYSVPAMLQWSVGAMAQEDRWAYAAAHPAVVEVLNAWIAFKG